MLKLNKSGYDDEMADLIRSRTELKCIIDDLQQADERGQEQREEMELELRHLEGQITEREAELMELVPEYQERLQEEKEQKRRFDLVQLLPSDARLTMKS